MADDNDIPDYSSWSLPPGTRNSGQSNPVPSGSGLLLANAHSYEADDDDDDVPDYNSWSLDSVPRGRPFPESQSPLLGKDMAQVLSQMTLSHASNALKPERRISVSENTSVFEVPVFSRKEENDDEIPDYAEWSMPAVAGDVQSQLSKIIKNEALSRVKVSVDKLPFQAWKKRHWGPDSQPGGSAADNAGPALNSHSATLLESLQVFEHLEKKSRSELPWEQIDAQTFQNVSSKVEHHKLLKWLFPLCSA
eukprot:ANDGO_03868.mRNA.1 hypothetical protein